MCGWQVKLSDPLLHMGFRDKAFIIKRYMNSHSLLTSGRKNERKLLAEGEQNKNKNFDKQNGNHSRCQDCHCLVAPISEVLFSGLGCYRDGSSLES